MTMPAEKPLGLNHTSGENRRASKPLIEKRRRARINQSLAALKAIVVDSRKDPHSQNARPPKLEKADILEMTVTHLRKLHDCIEQSPVSENDGNSYKAGFFKCIQTIREFIQNENTLSFEQKTRLLSHLCNVTPTSLQASEPVVSQMDDTASSYSGSSRSNTPSSSVNDVASMEYVPCSPPLSDSLQDVSSNSSSPPSSTRTKLYKNHSNVSSNYNYLICNKHPSRLPSSTLTASSANRVDSEPVLYYMNGPLNLVSGPRNVEKNNERPQNHIIPSRNINEVIEAAATDSSERHQFFENRIAENESLMQIDPVWRPW